MIKILNILHRYNYRISQNTSQINGSSSRRPQTLMSPMSPVERKLISSPQNLTLTIHKDSGGYGMKVFKIVCLEIRYNEHF